MTISLTIFLLRFERRAHVSGVFWTDCHINILIVPIYLRLLLRKMIENHFFVE